MPTSPSLITYIKGDETYAFVIVPGKLMDLTERLIAMADDKDLSLTFEDIKVIWDGAAAAIRKYGNAID